MWSSVHDPFVAKSHDHAYKKSTVYKGQKTNGAS